MEKCYRDRIERGDRMSRFCIPSRSGIYLAIIGLLMMGVGIYRGEMPVVFEKAIHICLECIGIG